MTESYRREIRCYRWSMAFDPVDPEKLPSHNICPRQVPDSLSAGSEAPEHSATEYGVN